MYDNGSHLCDPVSFDVLFGVRDSLSVNRGVKV